MTSKVLTSISEPLYNILVAEKRRLQMLELKKVRSRRRRVTMITASQSIVRRLRR